MSLLSEFIQKEQQLKQLQAEMDKLQNDERLKAELEFKDKLEALMREFNKSAADVINLLDPQGAASLPPPSRRQAAADVASVN